MNDRASSLEVERDPFDEFLTAGLRAINRFAFCELVRLAKIVRADIRHNPPSGIYGDYDHRDLWDEYCQEVADGPGMLESAWHQTLYPYVAHRLGELPHETAVLITMATQWDDCEFEGQEGECRDDGRNYRALESAIRRLADEEPGHVRNDWGQEDELDV